MTTAVEPPAGGLSLEQSCLPIYLAMTRFHDLDALRCFAMLLVIVVHAGAFLLTIDIWPVHEEYALTTEGPRNPNAYLLLAIQGSAMPLFFMISGFFAAMLLQSRELYRLARQRFKHIVQPLAVCLLTIVPVCAWLFTGSDFTLQSWPVVWLEGLYHPCASGSAICPSPLVTSDSAHLRAAAFHATDGVRLRYL